MKTAVMTDTNSGITKQEADALGIFLMQMPVIIDGETHYEGLDLTHDSFFAALTGNKLYQSLYFRRFHIDISFDLALFM